MSEKKKKEETMNTHIVGYLHNRWFHMLQRAALLGTKEAWKESHQAYDKYVAEVWENV